MDTLSALLLLVRRNHQSLVDTHYFTGETTFLKGINEGELTGACLLDISKCFDSINHDILLKKLEMYRFQDV